MFSKKQRIDKKLFDEVFSFGKTIKTNYFLLKYNKNEDNITRISVVASKKNFKTAVSRNSIKRRFIAILKETKIKESNNNLIFILNKTIEKANDNELVLIINQLRLK